MLSPAGPVRDEPQSMPDHVTFPARAGTAVAYDNSNRIWHNAFPNTSGQDRRCLICSYGPYGTSQSGQVVANARRLYMAGKVGADQPMLRQLLGWRLGLGEVRLQRAGASRAPSDPRQSMRSAGAVWR